MVSTLRTHTHTQQQHAAAALTNAVLVFGLSQPRTTVSRQQLSSCCNQLHDSQETLDHKKFVFDCACRFGMLAAISMCRLVPDLRTTGSCSLPGPLLLPQRSI